MKPWPEQRLRAELLAERGPIRMILPDEATPERLRAELSAALTEPRPGRRVDCDGAARCAEEIVGLLPG